METMENCGVKRSKSAMAYDELVVADSASSIESKCTDAAPIAHLVTGHVYQKRPMLYR